MLIAYHISLHLTGNFAVGAPSFLASIVSIVETSESKETRLLSLHALREAIFHCSRAQLESIADSLWVPLFEDSEAKDEANRIIVASCIGKLTTCNPAKYLPQLQVSDIRSLRPMEHPTQLGYFPRPNAYVERVFA